MLGKWRWIGHTLRRDSNNWHGKTSLELSATGKLDCQETTGRGPCSKSWRDKATSEREQSIGKKPCALECAGIQDDVAELT